MRKLFFFYTFFLFALSISAQDKIITAQGDTIECRIVSIGAEQISYEQTTANGYARGQSIPIGQVTSYIRLPQSVRRATRQKPERPWLFRVGAGGSWMPWLINDVEGVPSESKKLESGFHLNASGHYLLTPSFGVGLQYSFFSSKADAQYPIDLVGTNPFPVYTMLTAKEKQYINYFAPSATFLCFADKRKKIQLAATASVGVMFYHGESQTSMVLPDLSAYDTYYINSLIVGTTWAASVGLSAQYFVSPRISVGLGVDFLYGRLTKADVDRKDSRHQDYSFDDVDLDNALKISRLDYSLGISFYF